MREDRELRGQRYCQVEIYYPGDCISSNHYLGRRKEGGMFVRAEAKAWMDALGWLLKTYHIEDWRLPVTVRCSGWFNEHGKLPDLSNFSKCTLDAIEELTGINDRNFRWQDGALHIDAYSSPHLLMEVFEKEET